MKSLLLVLLLGSAGVGQVDKHQSADRADKRCLVIEVVTEGVRSDCHGWLPAKGEKTFAPAEVNKQLRVGDTFYFVWNGSRWIAEIKPVRVLACDRVPTEKPNSTGLQCSSDEKGPLILDIPETLYRFPEGDKFQLYIYSNGHQEFPVDKQPKGSVVIKTPPCNQPVFSYRKRGLQAPPCNPDLN